MKRSHIIPPALAAGILGIASPSVLAQTTVFNDTFGNGSTVQTTASAPTANSTTYQWFQQGGDPTMPTIAAGDLHLIGRNTTSSIAEAQALFTASPVTLATVGDSLTLTIAFKNTDNIFPSGSDSTINVGLFNAHGVAPNVGAQFNTGTYLTGGGAQNWNGYVARIRGSGGASSMFTRAPQGVNGTTSQNQDALFNGASGSASYNNPGGTTFATSGGNFAGFAAGGNNYVLSYTITLSAVGTLTINNNLFDASNLLTPLISQTGTRSTGIETTYDGLAFGWRYNFATAAANSIDVSSINVSDTIAVPEPTTVAFAFAGFGYFLVRRFRR